VLNESSSFLPFVPSCLFLLPLLITGCAASHAPETITEDQFVQYYQDQTTYTDVYYMGSDNQFDYFCMEHWTLTNADKPETASGKMDSQNFYKVAVTPERTQKVKKPFPLTYVQDNWRLMRPHP
jgi:hypothetical protein